MADVRCRDCGAPLKRRRQAFGDSVWTSRVDGTTMCPPTAGLQILHTPTIRFEDAADLECWLSASDEPAER